MRRTCVELKHTISCVIREMHTPGRVRAAQTTVRIVIIAITPDDRRISSAALRVLPLEIAFPCGACAMVPGLERASRLVSVRDGRDDFTR